MYWLLMVKLRGRQQDNGISTQLHAQAPVNCHRHKSRSHRYSTEQASAQEALAASSQANRDVSGAAKRDGVVAVVRLGVRPPAGRHHLDVHVAHADKVCAAYEDAVVRIYYVDLRMCIGGGNEPGGMGTAACSRPEGPKGPASCRPA